MDELEQRLRTTLHAADSMAVPELDPSTLVARASAKRPRSRLWSWLVAVVAAVALAVSGAVAVSTARAGVTVTVQFGDGSSDPVVGLDGQVATDLFAMVEDRRAAGEAVPSDAPAAGQGFSGFRVVASDAAKPEVVVLPDVVYVRQTSGWHRIADASGTYYARLWDVVVPQLSESDRDRLPATNPAIPRTSAAIPPQVGVTGVWELADPSRVSPASTSLKLKVTRMECASGHTGRILEPVVSYGASDIVIRTDVAQRRSTADTCQSNDWVTVTLALAEPVGDRQLIDAACLAGDAVRTSFCAAGAARWRP